MCEDGKYSIAGAAVCSSWNVLNYWRYDNPTLTFLNNPCSTGNTNWISGTKYEPLWPPGTYQNAGVWSSCPVGHFWIDSHYELPCETYGTWCAAGYFWTGGAKIPNPNDITTGR